MHMQVVQQSLFKSQPHVIQVHKYCVDTVLNVDFFGIYLPRKMKVESDLSLVRDEFLVRYDC